MDGRGREPCSLEGSCPSWWSPYVARSVTPWLQEAEGYRAQVVNEAKGEAARFESVYEEYILAPAVTRKRLYLETMERVLGSVDKIIIDGAISGAGGQGVVPYLPLNELRRGDTK